MSIYRYFAYLGLGLVPCLIGAAHAAAPLPSHLSFLPSVEKVEAVDYESWNEHEFPPGPGADPEVPRQGKHWHIYGLVNGNSTEKHATWAPLKAGFVAAGWTVVKEFDTQPLRGIMHFSKNGLDVWADVNIYAPPAENMEVIEVGPLPITLALAPPASTPEHVLPEKGDFPYLAPLPGSKTRGGHHDPSPMYLTLPGAGQAEIVATGSVSKSYHADGVSLLEWYTLYHDALVKAGWTIMGASHSADAAINAHYGLNGRNIWAALHMNNDGYDISVGDEGVGGGKLDSALATECHVALTGVLFDFNKSTLKPESDAVLEQVRRLLVKDAALKLEVQGHTDNVGTDVYNQTLSESRAAAVLAWLTQHGVVGGRLSAKGYGKSVPVADNRTDEGRAKNRRVEIANLACTRPQK